MDNQTQGPENSRDLKIAALEQKLAVLERKIPETGVLSDNFLKRAFVIWGHYFVANFIIGFGVFICVGMFMLFLLAMGVALFN